MGYAVHSVEGLGPPFLLVDEMVFVIPRGGEVRLARHHFKFLFILGGEFEHEIEGMEGRRKLGPGDILVAPLVERHCYVNPHPRKAAQAHVVRLFLDGAFLKKHAARRTRKPETDFADFVIHHFPQVVQLPGGIDNEITELVTALRRETEERATGFRHRVRSICTDLIVTVARRAGAATGISTKTAAATMSSSSSSTGHTGATIVAAAKEYVLKHLAEDMALGEIAWHVGRGEEHLARVFKRETGRSVFDYVREMRINEAKTHLLDPALTLTVIAERCGFHSLSFFSRTFRQHVGMSPSAWRQHAQAELRPMVRR